MVNRMMIANLIAAIVLPALQVFTVPQDRLDFVCSVRQLDCSGLPAPEVRFTDLPDHALGMYSLVRPNVIWLDVALVDPLHAEAIVVHEVSHYVDYHLGLPLERCTSEAAAFRVYNAWVVTQGYPPGYTRYDWFIGYGCYQ